MDASVDERFELAKKKRLCFCCLKYGHSLNDCKGKKKCGVENCERSHHQTLHKREVSSKPETVVVENSEGRMQIHMARVKENPRVILKVAPVIISGPKGNMETFALLNDGATASLIENEVAIKLGLNGHEDPLEAEGIGAITFADHSSRRVTATIQGRNCDESFVIKNLRTIKGLKLPSQSVNVRHLREEWNYLPDVDLNCLKNAKPTILIGHDNISLITGRELIEGPRH